MNSTNYLETKLPLLFGALFVIGLIAPFAVYPTFLMKILCYALFACAFNLLLGFAGLLSFGHAAFLGTAGYVCGLMVRDVGVTPEVGILAGTVAAGLLGWLFGTLAIRRTGIYFAMITLALAQMVSDPDSLCSESRESLLQKARQGEVFVIDVRPPSEYNAGHLPFARSMPLGELEKRLADLPSDRTIVAYCRGPFCLMSDEAVKLLRARGFTASKITDGVNEWVASGLPIET